MRPIRTDRMRLYTLKIRLSAVAMALVFVLLSAGTHRCWAQNETSGARSLDGFWMAQGYGLLFEIRNTKVQAYQVTSLSCLRDWEAKAMKNEAGELIYM